MKNIVKTKENDAQGFLVRQWLNYDLTEDDFLSGKPHEFSSDAWEAEE
jgi:hypothetical protein